MLWDRAWTSGEPIGRMLDELPVAAVVMDLQQQVTYVNRQFESLTRRRNSDIVGGTIELMWGEDSEDAALRGMQSAIASARPFRGTVLAYRGDGTVFWNRIALTPVRDRNGDVLSFMAFMDDVSAEVEERSAAMDHARTGQVLVAAAAAFSEATDQEGVAAALAEAVVDGGARWAAVVGDSSGAEVRVNGVARAGGSFTGDPLPRGLVVRGSEDLQQVLTLPRPMAFDHRNAPSRVRRWMERNELDRVLATPLPAHASARGFIVALWPQLSRAAEANALDRMARIAELGAIAFRNVVLLERLSSVANRDSLTGAASRTAFHRRLEAALDDAGGDIGLVYLDVDRFKQVNDSLGHSGGDAVLTQLFDRVAAAIDGDSLVGRTGGDEFVLLVQGSRIPERLDALTDMMGRIALEPFEIEGRPVYVSCSAGSVIGRKEPGEATSDAAERLLRAADAQMYATKRSRRGRHRPETDLDVLELEAELHRAVAHDEITAQFQPQFDATSGRVAGFEVLARWSHPRFGAVPPGLFIPLADEIGLAGPLGDRILRQAFTFAEQASARDAIQISVNLSAQQMLATGFVDRFADLLNAHPGRTWAVTAEIAEAHFVANHAALQSILSALRALDVDIAIDNFGTGQASLALLQELPVTAIKIDKSFVRRMGALGGGMIGAIVSLARGLGLGVLVEGVDQPDQYEVLQRFGCDRLQGYLLAAPMDAAEALGTPLAIRLPRPGGDGSTRQERAGRRFG